MVQPPRPAPASPARSAGEAGPAFFQMHGGSSGQNTPGPSTPHTYRTEQGVWGTPGALADSSSTDMEID
eukprot:6554744-Alexandrium_andersonii.AAC.1